MELHKEYLSKAEKIIGNKITAVHLVQHRGSSDVFVVVSKTRKRYALKMYQDKKVAAREMQNHELLSGISKISKPEFLGFGEKMFVMSFAEGEVFQDLIDHNSKKDYLDLYQKAINEMVLLHTTLPKIQSTRNLVRIFYPHILKSRMAKQLTIIQNPKLPMDDLSEDISPEAWKGTLKKVPLEKLYDHLAIDHTNAVLGHGDYKPSNIITSKKNRVVVIDWRWMPISMPWYDLASLLYQVDSEQQSMLIEKYIGLMQDRGWCKNVKLEDALKRFKSGLLYFAITRAASNAFRMKGADAQNHVYAIQQSRRLIESVLAE